MDSALTVAVVVVVALVVAALLGFLVVQSRRRRKQRRRETPDTNVAEVRGSTAEWRDADASELGGQDAPGLLAAGDPAPSEQPSEAVSAPRAAGDSDGGGPDHLAPTPRSGVVAAVDMPTPPVGNRSSAASSGDAGDRTVQLPVRRPFPLDSRPDQENANAQTNVMPVIEEPVAVTQHRRPGAAGQPYRRARPEAASPHPLIPAAGAEVKREGRHRAPAEMDEASGEALFADYQPTDPRGEPMVPPAPHELEGAERYGIPHFEMPHQNGGPAPAPQLQPGSAPDNAVAPTTAIPMARSEHSDPNAGSDPADQPARSLASRLLGRKR